MISFTNNWKKNKNPINKRSLKEVVTNLNFNSDHRLVRGTIVCKEFKTQRRKFHTTNNRTLYIPEENLNELKQSLEMIEKINKVQDKFNFFEKNNIKTKQLQNERYKG